MVNLKERNVAGATLALACISCISCSVVALSIRFDRRSAKSYHLRLVQGLLQSDIGLSMSIIVYFAVQYHLSGDSLQTFCKSFLPFLVYFFLVSSAWTVMLALRFRMSQSVSANANKPPVPMYAIWLIPLVPAAIMMGTSLSLDGVANVNSLNNDTNKSCQFNHATTSGILVDLFCFQGPLILIIIINVYHYAGGLLELKNAPHSVLARQLKRAGGYIAVLVAVWVPNIAYNLLVMSDKSSEPYVNFLILTVMLSASQVRCSVCYSLL
jgi:hypothetical protein